MRFFFMVKILEENKEVFDFLGITKWLEQGFTGKGRRYGLLDAYFNFANTPLEHYVTPISIYKKPPDPNNYPYKNHIYTIAALLNQIKPDAHIYYGFPHASNLAYHFRKGGTKYGIPRDTPGVHAVSMSLALQDDKDFFGHADDLDFINDEFPLHVAAGNEGLKGLSKPASNLEDNWIAWGALGYENGKLFKRVYSAVGKQLDFMMIDGLTVELPDGTKHKCYGTSYAAPLAMAMIDTMFEKAQLERYPRWALKENLKQFSVDLEDEGFDIDTGYGLFKMPEPAIIREGRETPIK